MTPEERNIQWTKPDTRLPWVFICLTGLVLAVAITIAFWPTSTYAPMYGTGFSEPQQVLEQSVTIGDTITVAGVVKCNSESNPIAVTGVSQWRRIDDGGHTIIPDAPRAGGKLQPGCYPPRTFENKLPEGITPGTWVHEGINSTYRGKQRQVVHWTTESFRVVDR